MKPPVVLKKWKTISVVSSEKKKRTTKIKIPGFSQFSISVLKNTWDNQLEEKKDLTHRFRVFKLWSIGPGAFSSEAGSPSWQHTWKSKDSPLMEAMKQMNESSHSSLKGIPPITWGPPTVTPPSQKNHYLLVVLVTALGGYQVFSTWAVRDSYPNQDYLHTKCYICRLNLAQGPHLSPGPHSFNLGCDSHNLSYLQSIHEASECTTMWMR